MKPVNLLVLGMWLDPHMSVMHRGRERSANEYRELYAQSGFELEQIVQTASPHSLIMGRPRASKGVLRFSNSRKSGRV